MSTIKIREDRLRRLLTKHGYQLHKTPARSWLRKHYGAGYMITLDNYAVSGCYNREYEDTLERVEAFAKSIRGLSREPPAQTA
jgi:hypothetical protein